MRKNGKNISSGGRFKVRPEDVIEATSLAANWQPFEVTYYPRVSSPEFCVCEYSRVLVEDSFFDAFYVQRCAGMRFKEDFETEDSSRISWFMVMVSCVQVVDPFFWPNSPWPLLQVNCYESDLLKNVSPWLVELVSNMPHCH